MKTGAERLSNTGRQQVHPATEASKTQVRTEAGTNADGSDPIFSGGRAGAVGSRWTRWEAGIGSLPRVWEHQSCICIMVRANIRSGWAPKQEFTKGSFTVGERLTSFRLKKINRTEMSVYLLMHKFFERPTSRKIVLDECARPPRPVRLHLRKTSLGMGRKGDPILSSKGNRRNGTVHSLT